LSPTPIERSITQRRRADGLLRPLLEEMFRDEVRIENDDDLNFIRYAAAKSVGREQDRERNSVFSPSGLASCLRRVYLGRHWKSLDLERIVLPNVQTQGTFSQGDWVHLQWHFYLFKLDVMFPDKFMLVDIEIPVMSKRKDHGGTIDAVGFLIEHDLPVLIDYKGWNVRNWQQALTSLDHATRIQVTDYMMLLNSNGGWKSLLQIEEREGALKDATERIEDALVLAINKGGPDPKHPLALNEIRVSLSDNLPDVHARLGVLRQHEAEKEIPAPECTSTKTIQFQGCPFAAFCKEEVTRIERRIKSSDPERPPLRVATPTGDDRSRRPRAKRGSRPS
jgi:hypothetical protein